MKQFFFILACVFIPYLSNSQNVGISDVLFTPQSPLHIYRSADGNLLQLSNSTAANSGFQISVTGNNYDLINRQAGYLSLWTSNTERFRINNLGYTGVRTMFPNSWLHVDGDGVTTTFRVQNNGSSKLTVGTNGGVTIGTFNDTPPVNGLYVFGNTGIGVASPTSKFHVNGTVRFENLSAPAGETTALVIDVNGNVKGRVLDAVAFNGYTETDPSAWSLTGNGGTVDGVNFLGTTDNVPLDIRTNNVIRVHITTKSQIEVLNSGRSVFLGESAGENDDLTVNYNVFIGYFTGNSNTSGYNNTAIGSYSFTSNTTSYNNTAIGSYALNANITGSRNVAVGSYSLRYNTSAGNNVAIGYYSMLGNTTGENNIAVGTYALRTQSFDNSGIVYNSNNIAIGTSALYYTNPTFYLGEIRGVKNIAIGSYTLFRNMTGSRNIAIGDSALLNSIGTNQNIAIGAYTLQNQSYNGSGVLNANNIAIGAYVLNANQIGAANEGKCNTSVGTFSMRYNTSGYYNTALGYSTMNQNTTGSRNVAMGLSTLYNNTTGYNNTAIGAEALGQNISGYQNTALGYFAGYNGTGYYNSTALGAQAPITGNNMARIGNASVTSIGGFVNWTNISDNRVKENIKNDVPGISFIMLLKPVSYNLNIESINQYNNLPDSVQIPEKNNLKNKIRYTGFIAQEVEAAAIACGYDFSGIDKPTNEQSLYGLRYAEFVVPMVQAIQEQQMMIEDQQDQIEELRLMIQQQQKQIDELMEFSQNRGSEE